MQKNWIGRSEGLLVRFTLDPQTTPDGESELDIFTTRPDTLFGAKFMALSPDHPLAQAAAKKNPALAEFIAECKRHGTAQEIIDKAGEARLRHRHQGGASVRPDRGNCRSMWRTSSDGLWHRRHLRLPGARSARPRFRQQIRPRRHAGRLPPEQDPKSFVITDTAYDGDGRMINSRFLDGMTTAQAEGGCRAAAGKREARRSPGGAASGELSPARLGYFAAALLGLSDSGHSLRRLRRRSGAGKICR